MDVLDLSKVLIVKVFDEDLTSNDLICEGTINLAALCVSEPIDEWF